MQAGGERIYIAKLIAHLGEVPLDEIDQAVVDGTAATLYPSASNATRNRQVYTPISAILRHAKVALQLERPKDAQGQQLTDWLTEDEAFALLREAANLDQEFAALCTFLLYTGCRLSEALKMQCKDVNLAANECFCGKTKNGEPRRVFLPMTLVARLSNHPRGLDRKDERVFRFTKGKHVYKLLRKAAANAGVTLPRRCAFHLFRHTYATWMRRHAGADVDTLVGTGAWKSRQAASRYMHMVTSEEAKRAALLPAPKSKSG
jgi:integrase